MAIFFFILHLVFNTLLHYLQNMFKKENLPQNILSAPTKCHLQSFE